MSSVAEPSNSGPRITSVPKHSSFQTMSTVDAPPLSIHKSETELKVAAPPRLAVVVTPAPPEIPSVFAVALPVIVHPPVHIASASPETLAAIKPGTSYDMVVKQLGVPAMRMASYEDGHMMETLRIESKGSRIGTIHVIDGQVESVDLAN